MKTAMMNCREAATLPLVRTGNQSGAILIYGLGSVACLAGFLAVAGILAGMVASGGPLGLVSSWLTAVFGV